jgi:protein-S-isoprenylcysteine O-methyltransferase Ste14
VTDPDSGPRSGLPALGPRGEGWVIGQGLLLALTAILGMPGLASLPPTDAGRWLTLGLGLLLLVVGGVVGLAGVRALGSNLTAAPRPKDEAEFVEAGIYRVIRHPLYAAVASVATGWAVAMGSLPALLAAVALAAWLDAKARREEAWLLETYPEYAAYRGRTHRFIPGVY